MAKAKSTALQTSDEEREAKALAELGDFFDSTAFDGMDDVDGEDIKLAVKLFNMGGVDSKTGNSRLKNAFFDNVTEETQETIECVILLTQKTHRWDLFDNAAKVTNVICDSPDRRLGVLRETNEQRECQGCPDRGWFKHPETGDPMRKCGEVHNVVLIELPSQRPFMLRFKKTSLKPFRNYLMQNHFNARQKADGTRGNVPLFAFVCKMSLVMHEGGNYAIPVLERGRVLTRAEVMSMHESAKGYMEMMGAVLEHADRVETSQQSDPLDSNMSAGDFAD